MSRPPKDNAKFEALLDFLRQTRGFDFTGYKRPSLVRRINKRMEMIHVSTYEDYMDYLEVHPEEFNYLFNTILINITAFFRDGSAWNSLAEETLPRLLEKKGPDEPIRAWSAGTSSGEEAYTIAMVLAEKLGAEAFKRRVKIYATDIDEEALAAARQAGYNEPALEPVPAELRKKYFEPANKRYVFRADLRRAVIFGRHDLIQDAPISHLDLLVCRNTLMYFNAETQMNILGRFHFALGRDGLLFLGKAELLLTHAKLFTPVDMRNRIFVKAENANLRERIFTPPPATVEANHVARQIRLRDLCLELSPVARIVVNTNGLLVLATQKAKTLFSLIAKDIGRPIQDLEIYYRPADLRPLIEQAYAERRTVSLNGVERVFPNGEKQYFDVQVVPLYEDSGTQLGVAVAYIDVSQYTKLQEELQHANQELETTSEELQSTNEELETTNEELQSTNEELETTNEELQSTNEELETMNEELQSTNEELYTLNEEMRQRTDELNNSNAFLNSILSSMRAAIIVLDNDLIVHIWNLKAQDLWGLRPEEAQGKAFMNLDIGLRVEELKRPIRACLLGETEHEDRVVEAVNRRGRKVRCRVSCYRFTFEPKKEFGVILLMEEVD